MTSRDTYDRQLRFFGSAGQARLARCTVAVIGLGGIGSLLTQLLARLGVGQFILVDDDFVEYSNLSRVVGASRADADQRTSKVTVANRVILEGNPNASIRAIIGDVAEVSIAKSLTSCDYLFLAADSMRARLVVNAIVHQYLLPGVQLGTKIRADETGAILDAMSANRPLRPGQSCLWCNQLIDPNALALESKSDEERKQQAYGVQEPNPSVITLNGIVASHAANDFLLDFLGLRPEQDVVHFEHFHYLSRSFNRVLPRQDNDCPECSTVGARYGRGDTIPLPCLEA